MYKIASSSEFSCFENLGLPISFASLFVKDYLTYCDKRLYPKQDELTWDMVCGEAGFTDSVSVHAEVN